MILWQAAQVFALGASHPVAKRHTCSTSRLQNTLLRYYRRKRYNRTDYRCNIRIEKILERSYYSLLGVLWICLELKAVYLRFHRGTKSEGYAIRSRTSNGFKKHFGGHLSKNRLLINKKINNTWCRYFTKFFSNSKYQDCALGFLTLANFRMLVNTEWYWIRWLRKAHFKISRKLLLINYKDFHIIPDKPNQPLDD